MNWRNKQFLLNLFLQDNLELYQDLCYLYWSNMCLDSVTKIEEYAWTEQNTYIVTYQIIFLIPEIIKLPN